MNFNDYQKWARSTVQHPQETEREICYLSLGLGNEAGEVQGVIKKWMRGDFEGQEESKMRYEALYELGDTLWYLARLADVLGFNLEHVADFNRLKLEQRKARGNLKGEHDDGK